MKKYIHYKASLSLGLLTFGNLCACAKVSKGYAGEISTVNPTFTNLTPQLPALKEDNGLSSPWHPNLEVVLDAIKSGYNKYEQGPDPKLKNAMVLSKKILGDLIARNFSKEQIEYYKSKGLNILEAVDDNGRNLFMHVSEEYLSDRDKRRTNDFKALEQAFNCLLDLYSKEPSGKKLNHQDNNGDTVLHIAAYKFNFSTMQILIQAGADPSIQNKQGFTARAFLEQNSNSEQPKYPKSDMDALIESTFQANSNITCSIM
ncbi:Ankyrin repeats containing protein [Cardinium endosymbiont of Sogatella furcifera]|uniref:ankyrin repeat domain-containing protein n=1 Tax=Cardinium endosymbiont of Sogatella furcifera TaxID=650378 RepID=UPI000E0D633A|nr:ankyrin repeat domain-containing protein [Cardinium endosymbiont of Sogatella furcifera]AXI24134.1 Ankyrin repeats containing protein [Cardinium endosymbiont of Sogatella furcifera]